MLAHLELITCTLRTHNLRIARCGDELRAARQHLQGAVPGFPRRRGSSLEPRSRLTCDRAATGPGFSDLSSAAALLGGLFLLAARPQGPDQTDSTPVYRSRAAYHRHSGRGGARGYRTFLAR